jgi:TetR/AcrR family transcriptional regulator, cholesterol catabolism regulator
MSSPPGVAEGVEGREAREGRRERRARETRQRILESAFALFGERGVDGVTVEEIAERAEVARGTVFNYFSSKESLCCALGALMLDRVQEGIEQGETRGFTASEKIGWAMRLLTDFPTQEPARFREVMLRGLASTPAGELPEHRKKELDLLESWVLEGQSSGEFRTDYPAIELAGFMLGLHFQATLIWAMGYVPGSPADHAGRMLQLALEGVRSRAER